MFCVKLFINELDGHPNWQSDQAKTFFHLLGNAVNETAVINDLQELAFVEMISCDNINRLSAERTIAKVIEMATWINSCR